MNFVFKRPERSALFGEMIFRRFADIPEKLDFSG